MNKIQVCFWHLFPAPNPKAPAVQRMHSNMNNVNRNRVFIWQKKAGNNYSKNVKTHIHVSPGQPTHRWLKLSWPILAQEWGGKSYLVLSSNFFPYGAVFIAVGPYLYLVGLCLRELSAGAKPYNGRLTRLDAEDKEVLLLHCNPGAWHAQLYARLLRCEDSHWRTCTCNDDCI